MVNDLSPVLPYVTLLPEPRSQIIVCVLVKLCSICVPVRLSAAVAFHRRITKFLSLSSEDGPLR